MTLSLLVQMIRIALTGPAPGRSVVGHVFVFLFSGALIAGLPGGLLTYFGHRYLKRRRLVVAEARKLAEDEGKVDPAKLCAKAGLDIFQVRKMLSWAQRKGQIPASFEIL